MVAQAIAEPDAIEQPERERAGFAREAGLRGDRPPCATAQGRRAHVVAAVRSRSRGRPAASRCAVEPRAGRIWGSIAAACYRTPR